MTSRSVQDNVVQLPLCGRTSTVEELYALMYAIRTFEQSLLELFDQSALAGTTHTYLGQEATAVGVISVLDRDIDITVSNHRGHGHFLSFCGEIERLYLEIMGKPGGVCGGRGGSQHLHYRNFYSNGVLGGTVPVAVGAALAEKQRGSGAVTVVFLGDGSLGEGVVYESFNIASLWRLPIPFVIENNGFAQSTPYRFQIAGEIIKRPESFGIPSEEHTTTDVRQVLSKASELVATVRSESRPRCLIIHNYRLGPHSKGDDHRDPQEIEGAWQREPLRVLRPVLNEQQADQLETEAAALVQRAMEHALAAPTYDI